ncbi:MAG: metalloregulator ArsR/SmtB family transcription factor [Alphaproteobacteria bacterium]|nr:metalloregulator ArsR/SmtB family transcription factor [Alphaproteobacteria bacterium]
MTELDELLTVLRTVAEPTRIRLLAICAQGELTVTELTRVLGQSQPRVSRHLKLMVDAGLLERFREGTWAFFRLARRGSSTDIAARVLEMVPANDPATSRDRHRLAEVKAERDRIAAAYFRKNAKQWDEIRRLHADDDEVEKALMALLGEAELGRMLDIGTGTGRMLELLGPRARRGIGIDLSREMLNVARANLERAGLDQCQVRLGDMYGLSAAGDRFDLVTIHQVLHYADQPGLVIAEAARVLAPGGRLVVVDFVRHDVEVLRTEHAHRRLGFEDQEIAAWCRAAALEPAAPVSIPGDPLTVKIWLAARQRDATAALDQQAD